MISLSIDNASVSSIVDDIKRLDAAGKKSIRQAANWAGVNICTSLASRTKVSKKTRNIVTRKYNGVSCRGVMAYRAGKEQFIPLFASKTFSAIPITAKSGKKLFLLKKENRYVTAEQFKSMLSFLVENKELLKIKMQGLAKRSWRLLQRSVNRGGNATDSQGGKNVNVGAVTWFGDNLTIHNRLGYIQDALRGGTSAVDMAIEKAAKSFKWKVDEMLGLHEIKTS